MTLAVANVDFEGRKNPKLHLRRRCIKKLRQQEKELVENCKILRENMKTLQLAHEKITPLPFDHPDAQRVVELCHLKCQLKINYTLGSHKDYRDSRIAYAKEAAKSLHLLKYVKDPIQINGISPNMAKNVFLDMFRPKTKEEKILEKFLLNEQKAKLERDILLRR